MLRDETLSGFFGPCHPQALKGRHPSARTAGGQLIIHFLCATVDPLRRRTAIGASSDTTFKMRFEPHHLLALKGRHPLAPGTAGDQLIIHFLCATMDPLRKRVAVGASTYYF